MTVKMKQMLFTCMYHTCIFFKKMLLFYISTGKVNCRAQSSQKVSDLA